MPRYARLIPFVFTAAACAANATALPDRIILVGDSTMASTTGYGDALCARFTAETACINLARGGRSSGSFRAEGRWDEVQQLLRSGAGFRTTYVLIQFGHNDQPGKPGRSTDFATEFPANMTRYVTEARALGATPVLVTQLTRRSFKSGYVHNDLAPWAGTVRQIARGTHTTLIDLNALSLAAVQAMGPQEADKLARSGEHFDYTHVGPLGADRFAAIMAQELRHRVPALAPALVSTTPGQP